jgi:hypothetical protein
MDGLALLRRPDHLLVEELTAPLSQGLNYAGPMVEILPELPRIEEAAPIRLAAVDGKRLRDVRVARQEPCQPPPRFLIATAERVADGAERAEAAVKLIWDATRADPAPNPIVLQALAREALIELGHAKSGAAYLADFLPDRLVGEGPGGRCGFGT